MLLARVVGEVVSTHKDSKIDNLKFLLVEKVQPSAAKSNKDYLVAIDSVGAGLGDVVLVVQGSSARMTDETTGRPCDAAIMAVVELVSEEGSVVYDKSKDTY